MTIVSLVYAQSRNGIIGSHGKLPWRLPSDLKRFKQVTMGKPIIMGRKTWDSLPRKPLPGRLNIVITRQKDFAAEGATVVSDVAGAMAAAGEVPEICVIGGGQIYAAFLPLATRVYLTEIDLEVQGDTFAPTLKSPPWREVSLEVHAGANDDDCGFKLRVMELAEI
jgi:dihydrofolate reductase